MLKRKDAEEQNFWISYADLMAGLLFVFILVVGAIVVKTVLISSDLEAIRADLQREKDALGLSEQALAEKKKRLRELQNALQASREENVHLGLQLSLLQTEAKNLKSDLEALRVSFEQKTAALALNETEMATVKALLLQTKEAVRDLQYETQTLSSDLNASRAQAAQLQTSLERAGRKQAADANLIRLRDEEVAQLEKALLLKTRDYQQVVEDLNLTRIKIKNLTGIKVKVVQNLKAKLGESIRIDPETGALRFASNILFNQGSAELKPGAKQELSRILGGYIDTLLSDPKMRRYIDLVTIEGHTNSDGTYLYNLQLSQQRALAVMAFLYEQFPKNRALFREYLSASGRAYAQPVLDAQGGEDKEASRRIEIKFRIKNEEAVQELMNYLNAARDTRARR